MDGREYSSPPKEFSTSAECSPPPEYSAASSEFRHLPEEFGSSSESKAAGGSSDVKRRRNNFIAAILALVVTASVGLADFGLKNALPELPASAPVSAPIEAEPPAALPEEPVQIEAEVPAPPEPVPEEPRDPYEGMPDAQVLVDCGPWKSGGLKLYFNPGGSGCWISDNIVGVIDHWEEKDGSVSFNGYAYEFTYGGSEENEVIDSYAEKQISGQVSLLRPYGTVIIGNPLGLEDTSFTSSSDDPNEAVPGILGWLDETVLQQLSKGTWIATDGLATGIQSLSFSEDGTVSLQINGSDAEGKQVDIVPAASGHEHCIVNLDAEEGESVFSYSKQIEYVVAEMVSVTTHSAGYLRYVTKHRHETQTAEDGIRFIISYGTDVPELIVHDPFTEAKDKTVCLRRFEFCLPESGETAPSE